MAEQAIAALSLRADGAYLDCTFGRGGHSRAIVERLSADGRLFVIDKDPAAIEQAEQLASADHRLRCWQGSFADAKQALAAMGVSKFPAIDGLLLDLGVSSPQLDDAERGFSFRLDGPLDMRMNPGAGPSAADWLNQASVEEIARVLWEFGEERRSRRIAAAIVAARPLERTGQLAELIHAAIGQPPGQRKHPATRSFQAIRIFINNELADLDALLTQSLELLNAGGRLVVISFHSLEDRRVKQFIRRESSVVGGRRAPPQPRPLRLRAIGAARRPSAAEIDANPRARSAIMRVAERLAIPAEVAR